jgi:PAS domain-containing protein
MSSTPVTIDIAVKRAEEALRDREERYRTLFDAMDEGYCIIEVLFDAQQQPVDYRFIEVNSSFERQRECRMWSESACWSSFLPSNRIGCKTTARWRSAARAFDSPVNTADCTATFDVYAFRANGWPERHVAVLFADVTQRTRAEQALREADRRKDEFLAMLAHELRNPLAAIRNAVQILLQNEN